VCPRHEKQELGPGVYELPDVAVYKQKRTTGFVFQKERVTTVKEQRKTERAHVRAIV
jgi:hypothetical protein